MIYPPSFNNLDKANPYFQSNLSTYFSECGNFNKTFGVEFGVDILNRITKVLELQGNKGNLGIPKNKSLTPFTFRFVLPEQCNIIQHCDSQFLNPFNAFYEHMTDKVDVHNQLSFFIVLQKPDSGGKLRIHDKTFSDATTMDLPTQSLKSATGDSFFVEDPNQVSCIEPNLEEGDLLIFAGGELWRKVTRYMARKTESP